MWDRFTFILFSVCFFRDVAGADTASSEDHSSSSPLLKGFAPASGACFRWKSLRNPFFDFLPVINKVYRRKEGGRETGGEGERSVCTVTAIKNSSCSNSLEPKEEVGLLGLAPFLLPGFFFGIPLMTICLRYESSIVGSYSSTNVS